MKCKNTRSRGKPLAAAPLVTHSVKHRRTPWRYIFGDATKSIV